MKQSIKFIVLFSFMGTFAFGQGKSKLTENVAQRNLNEAGQPTLIQFKNDKQPKLRDAKVVLKDYLALPAVASMHLLKNEVDEIGVTHQKYQQYYENLPVEFASYTLHAKGDALISMTGEYYDIPYLNISPGISKATAEANAKKNVGASALLDGATESAHMAGYEGLQTELVIFPKIEYINETTRLAYKMDIYSLDPLYRALVYVDAQTGEVFFENSKIHHTDIAASGNSVYDGNVSFTADYTGSNYRLRQTSSGSGIQTFNMNNGTSYTASTDYTSTSTNFTNTKGVQAHYAAEQTHEYYLQNHNRNSYNGSGAIIKSYVSYSSNYVNAFWNGSVMTYGDGNGTTYGPLITLDIVGHEITHGVTENSANLVYQKESGALNESFSDIFGELIEKHGKGTNNWLMGSEIYLTGSSALRSMSNPKQYGDPDCYGGTYWINPNCAPSSGNDYCGVHTNSGVQNKWFYLLSQGGSATNDLGNAYSVSGIGMANAAAIAYRNLTVYLTSNSTFANARAGAILSAIDLFGAGSPEEIATTDAWYAVGVGSAYGPVVPPTCVDGNITLTLTLDNYPTETSWTVKNASNVTVASGSGYSVAGSTVTVPLTLADGNYTWAIVDSYGDGICCSFGNGGYTLVSGSTTIKAGGAYGSGESQAFCVTNTGGGPDVVAPSNPTNLSASGTTTNSTNLNWTASTDNVGVTGYTVYRNGVSIGNITGTSMNVTGLSASTTYSFYVRAYDAAGNISGNSNTINVTTGAAADLTPPSTPTNLAASGTTTNSTNLAWSASTDNVGVALYRVYQNGSSIGTSTTPSYSVTGLNASTIYSYYVLAEDAAGNVSGNSNTVNVTTDATGGGSSVVLHQGYFESGWDGWADGGSDCARYSGSRSSEGSFSIYIRDNSGTPSAMTSPALNLTGFDNVKVEFLFYANSMEVGEDFWLRYSSDGSTYTTVASWARGTSFNNNTYYMASMIIPSSMVSFVSSGRFRFQCDASANDDLIYIDAVVITGYVGAVPAINSIVGNNSSLVALGTLDDPAMEMVLFPNPANDFIQVKGIENMENYQVFDLQGKLMFEGTFDDENQEIAIRELPAGMYMIKVSADEEVHIKRFVKE